MNMGLILLSAVLWTAVGLRTRQEGLQLEMNHAIPYEENAVGYDCESVRQPAILAVCRLCDASAAYSIYHGNVDFLTGLYSEELAMLNRAVEQVRNQLPTANYTVAFKGTDICIAAVGIEEKPNFQRVFSQFSHISEGELEVPELFSREAYAELDFIAVKTKDRTDDEYQYEDLTIRYRIEDRVKVSGELVLGLEAMTLLVEGDSASVAYTGLIAVNDQLHSFTLSVAYSRPAHAPFTVSITPAQPFPAEVWLAAVGSQCDDIVPVPGVPRLTTQPLSLLNLVYSYNSESSVMELAQVIGFFPVPSVALLPHISLPSPTGQFILSPSAHTCFQVLSGPASYSSPMHLSLIADHSHWFLTGGLDAPSITVAKIEETLYTDLFAGMGQAVLPQYVDGANQGFLYSLSQLTFTNATVRIVPEPALTLSIQGEVSWGGNPSTDCQVIIGWVDSIVESVLILSVSHSSDFIPGDHSLTVISSRLVAATALIDLVAHPYMRGSGNEDVREWRLGVYGDTVLTTNDYCDRTDFCGVLTASTGASPVFHFEGTVWRDQLVLRTPLPDVKLSPRLEVTEAELVIETSLGLNTVYISGAVVVATLEPRNSIVRFVGKVLDSDGAALLEARSEDRWETGVDGLSVGRVEMREAVGRNGGVEKAVLRGKAGVGEGCGEMLDGDGCVGGTIEIALDPLTFSPLLCMFHTSAISISQLSQTLLGLPLPDPTNIPFALAGLSLGSTLDVEFLGQKGELGAVISGSVQYFGVNGWLEVMVDRLAGDYAVLTIQLDEFYIGTVGLWVLPSPSSPLTLELLLDPSRPPSSSLSGQVQFWDFTSSIILSLSDSGLTGDFSGSTAGSNYTIAFTLSANRFDTFAGADATLIGTISVEQLRSVEMAVRTDLLFWVNQGLAAIETIDMWKDNAALARAVSQGILCPSAFCPELYTCVTPPAPHCKLFASEQVCIHKKTVCSEREQVCVEEQQVCVVQGQECVQWEGLVCVLGKDVCEQYMNVCKEWGWKCTKETEGSCEIYEVRTLSDTCLEYEETCEMASYIDPGCIFRCQQTTTDLSDLAELEKKYTRAYEATLPQLVGFTTMAKHVPSEQYRSDLFYIGGLSFQVDLSKSSVSLSSLPSLASFSTFSAIGNVVIEARETVSWSLSEREINERGLFRAVKKILVDNSDGKLGDRLVTDTALEIIEDELYALPLSA